MKILTVPLSAVLLAGCVSAPVPLTFERLFNDARFAAPSQRIDAADVFAVSDEMREYVRTELTGEMRNRGRQQGLFDALYRKGQLRLDYDSGMTRNAAQAFAARAGNCLSLVIMTAAFAREIGLNVRYQSVIVEDTWGRTGDLYLAVSHVNLALAKNHADPAFGRSESEQLTIDFDPPLDLRRQRVRVIGEETIVAMYMNNRAVESLAAGNADDAYWWAREAIRQDPHFLSAQNTLGVIYQRHHDLGAAESVLNAVLEVEPANTQAMSNLATVLDEQGRSAEAAALKRRVAQIEPDPPFKYYKLGLVALQNGDYRTAKELFEKEVERAAYYHEFHFWLAIAHLNLGETRAARKHMTLALESSPTRGDHDLYAAKLDKIKASSLVR